MCLTFKHRKIIFTKRFNQAFLFLWKLLFTMKGFDVKVEGTFAGQVIPLLSVDGKVQGNLRNWSSAVSKVYGHFLPLFLTSEVGRSFLQSNGASTCAIENH